MLLLLLVVVEWLVHWMLLLMLSEDRLLLDGMVWELPKHDFMWCLLWGRVEGIKERVSFAVWVEFTWWELVFARHVCHVWDEPVKVLVCTIVVADIHIINVHAGWVARGLSLPVFHG